MGRLVSEETTTIEREFGEPYGQYTVVIKTDWSAGDSEHVTNSQMALNVRRGSEVEAEASLRLGKVAVAERIIKSWNVEDERGKPISVTPANIRRLPLEVFEWILTSWEEAQEQKKTFPMTSIGE